MKGFGDTAFPSYEEVLDEIAETGYEGTELGDWGFMPTDHEVLSLALAERGLALVGALLPRPLAERAAHAEAVEAALRTARLLAACAEGAAGAAFVILADENGADATRTKWAGRVRPNQGLGAEGWRAFGDGVDLVARAVKEETGLRTAFHHHCAGFVETPEETERLLDSTDPALVGLCFDTGHYAYAGGNPLDALKRWQDRIWHVHFKDCHTTIAARGRMEGWDYFTAVRKGVFHGLGGGAVDFNSIMKELRGMDYRGWIVVEDELPPGLGDPKDRAKRDREFLRELGL
jgi:inosose dehydratase